jgi:hypothetical protein
MLSKQVINILFNNFIPIKSCATFQGEAQVQIQTIYIYMFYLILKLTYTNL